MLIIYFSSLRLNCGDIAFIKVNVGKRPITYVSKLILRNSNFVKYITYKVLLFIQQFIEIETPLKCCHPSISTADSLTSKSVT